MKHRKEKGVHSKVQKHDISGSKSVVYRSCVSEQNADDEFRNESEEHEEAVETLKFYT